MDPPIGPDRRRPNQSCPRASGSHAPHAGPTAQLKARPEAATAPEGRSWHSDGSSTWVPSFGPERVPRAVDVAVGSAGRQSVLLRPTLFCLPGRIAKLGQQQVLASPAGTVELDVSPLYVAEYPPLSAVCGWAVGSA